MTKRSYNSVDDIISFCHILQHYDYHFCCVLTEIASLEFRFVEKEYIITKCKLKMIKHENSVFFIICAPLKLINLIDLHCFIITIVKLFTMTETF
jgi:hypothetical protein